CLGHDGIWVSRSCGLRGGGRGIRRNAPGTRNRTPLGDAGPAPATGTEVPEPRLLENNLLASDLLPGGWQTGASQGGAPVGAARQHRRSHRKEEFKRN